MSQAAPALTDDHVPEHVAIIMDGNGRWAKQRGLPRTAGHRAVGGAVRRTVRAASELGIGWLTLYAFSSENWARPKAEVMDLMGLLRLFIRRDLAELHRNNVRIRIIGGRDGVARDILALLDEAEKVTSGNTGLNLMIAFNYGARNELVRAAQALARKVAAGIIEPEEIDEALLGAELDTRAAPDPDLVIRTSGEQRLSNFLMWQAAYAELLFLPVYWPDFTKEHLAEAIGIFRGRERRFGGISATGTAL